MAQQVGGGEQEEGVAFKLSPSRTKGSSVGRDTDTVFSGGADGGSPQTGLMLDSAGNFYSTSGGGHRPWHYFSFEAPSEKGRFVAIRRRLQFCGFDRWLRPNWTEFATEGSVSGTTLFGGTGILPRGLWDSVQGSTIE